MKIKTISLMLPMIMVMLAGLLSSCFPERKLADTFVKEFPDIHLLVITPDYLYKFNHKGEEITGFDSMTALQQDSALYSSSLFVQNISDSVFLEAYINNFILELRELGFNVFMNAQADSILYSRPQAYIVNIDQIQLDEYTYPFEDEEYYYDTLYYKTLYLNALDFSCWYELSKIMRTGKPGRTILYTTHSILDEMTGGFYLDPFTQDVTYKYRIDSLTVTDIYKMASILGKGHASYLFDFFMNQYIAYHFPDGLTPQIYYHYNRYRKSFMSVYEPGFEILETQ